MWGESGLAMDAGDYPSSVDTGPPTHGDSACTRAEAAVGECTPGPVARWNPLERASPFRSALRWSGGAHRSGGTRRVQYFATGGASGEQGILAPNDVQRWNARLNVDATPHRTLRLALSGSHLASGTTLPVGDNFGIGTLEAGLLGNTADDPVNRGYYQVTPGLVETLATKQNLTRSLGSAAVEWSPRSWFSGRALIGRELVWRDDSRTYPMAVALGEPDRSGPWRIEGSAGRDKYTTASGGVTTTIPLGPLSASTTVGAERVTESLRKRDSTLFFFFSTGEPAGAQHIRSADRRKTVGLFATQRLAWGGRVLDLDLRHDGGDRFRLLKSATYRSASASWEIASEPFMGARLRRTGLRLHASYGEAGDARPARIALDGPVTLTPQFPGTPQPAGSSVFRPEKVAELDAGVEWFMWSDRVRVDATWYRQRSASAIERGCCIEAFAYTDDGTWRTTGLELTTSAQLLRTMSTEWDAQLTFATFSNRYRRQPSSSVGVFDLPTFGDATRRLVDGYPIAGTWGHRATGRDANGDGVIVRSEILVDTDSSYLGSSIPRQAGFATTLRLSHGRTRISALVDYHGGFVSRNQTEQHRCGFFICNALYDPNASVNDQTRAVLEFGRGTGFTERGDFVRLRELSITWSLFKAALWQLQAGELTLTVAGRNLATLTGYSGLDPEVNAAGQTSFGTTELFTLPLPRTLLIRVGYRR